MNNLELSTSPAFKTAAKKAILALLFFGLSYVSLLMLSVAFVFACFWGGIAIMSIKIGAVTLGFGLGLMMLGGLIFFFLIKFLFKKHIVDRSHLVELEESDSPILYQEIRVIVDKVQTSFPKKIYLSNDVNAAVFYDSTLLSMFFPIKKNLQIGLGLVNSVSAQELKAILAHEFGHFSQKSMKVGSYVYSINQIIYNLLYDNEGYNSTINALSGFSYFAIFVKIGAWIIEGIQWILKKLYEIVNLKHLGLSREMEFHADMIAAKTVGTKTFVNSLLKLDLADSAYSKVLDYYDQRIEKNIKPTNIYPQQFFVMNLMAKDAGIEIVNDLPLVTKEHLSRYNKSKIKIKNEWASHPSIEDRIAAIRKFNFNEGEDNGTLATDLFVDIANLQEMVTEVLFSKVNFKGKTVTDNYDDFTAEFIQTKPSVQFSSIFNGYYDVHQPGQIELDNSTFDKTVLSFANFFSADKIDLVYTLYGLQGDINFLKRLIDEPTDIKSFEYDGETKAIKDIPELLIELNKEEEELKTKIAINDLEIYQYFNQYAKPEQLEVFKEKYRLFMDYIKGYDQYFELYIRVLNETQFIQVTTPFTQIDEKLVIFYETEKMLKKEIKELLDCYRNELKEVDLKFLDKYLANELVYFTQPAYDDAVLDIFYSGINAFKNIITDIYLKRKSDLLIEIENLEQQINAYQLSE